MSGLEVWCFVETAECLTDQNSVELLYKNRNVLPEKRCFSGITRSAAERSPIIVIIILLLVVVVQ